MALTLNKSDLAGYIIRKATQDAGGRILDGGLGVVAKKDEQGNILSTLFDWTRKAAGFVWSAVGLVGKVLGAVLGFSWTALWGGLVSLTHFIYNFDFGATDKAIDEQMKATWQAYKGRVGGALGQSLGWFVCGIVPGAGMFVFNPVAGARVLAEVGQEAWDELQATLGQLATLGLQNIARSVFAMGYKNLRKWLQKPGNPLYNLLPQGLRDAWKTGKSWSISSAVEKRIEALPADWKNFYEELFEEFGDACTEAGFVVAGALDRWGAEQKVGPLGAEVVIEVQPNRESEEKYILAGPQEIVKAELAASLADYDRMETKDLGQVFAISASDFIARAAPLKLYLKLEFEPVDGGRRGEASYQIPNPKISLLDNYDTIRAACGGSNGYMWGPFKGVGRLSSGHNLEVYAATRDGAMDRLQAFASLSDDDLLTVDITEEIPTLRRDTIKMLKKPNIQIKPVRMRLINREYFDSPRPNARASKKGYYLPKNAILSLRGTSKPADWNQKISEILRGPTASTAP
jgi:hypothetical protein